VLFLLFVFVTFVVRGGLGLVSTVSLAGEISSASLFSLFTAGAGAAEKALSSEEREIEEAATGVGAGAAEKALSSEEREMEEAATGAGVGVGVGTEKALSSEEREMEEAATGGRTGREELEKVAEVEERS
jgi:hypothetical protein